MAQAIGDANFRCAEPPNAAQAGTYGPEDRPWIYDLAGGCFSGGIPEALKIESKKSANKKWSRNETSKLDAGAGVTLAKILPFIPAKWLPAAEVKSTKNLTISYSVEFYDTEVQTVRNLATALRDRLREAADGDNKKYQADIQACVSILCGGAYTHSGRAFLGKFRIRFDKNSASALKSVVGWEQLATDAHLNIVKNANGVSEIVSTERVVLAVESVKPKDVENDLTDGQVCASLDARAQLREALRNVAQGLVESYQCSALYAGTELANSVCTNNQVPRCGQESATGTAIETVPVPTQPAAIQPASATNACTPEQLLKVYQCRMRDFEVDVLKRACEAFRREANVALRGSGVSIRCDEIGSTWIHDHGNERLMSTLFEPQLQVKMLREFLSQTTAADLDTLLEAWRERFNQTQLIGARHAWDEAVRAFRAEPWPGAANNYSRSNWPEFQKAVIASVFEYLSQKKNLPSGFNPGCPQLVMGWDRATSVWRVVASNPQSKSGLVSFHGFGRARNTEVVALNFAESKLR